MVMTKSDQAQEYSFEKEQLEWQSIESQKERDFQKELRKMDIEGNVKVKMMELDAATARLRTATRQDVWKRGIIAFVKLPAIPLALIFLFILQLTNKPIPESLDEFLQV